ncbi:MAG TPA: PP2C family protein-serine/threonine phosphatase [Planctomycetota bacterium]|nr:PP2C family protein-serine/threonine phosphatase [Planctomycetota bacterium]
MAFFDKLKEKRVRERVGQELAANPAWKRYYLGRSWVCPYCAKAAIEDAKGKPDLMELVYAHLKACPEWKEFAGTPNRPIDLDQSIRKAEITQFMKTSPLWRVRDPAGQWYCPYCAKPTEVTFPSNKVNREIVDGIATHLDRCYAYEGGRGTPQTVQSLLSLIDKAERQKRLIPEIEKLTASEPLWQFKDDKKRWACPHCRHIISDVDLSSEFLVRSVAPRQIAKHLIESCPAYKDGAAPQATVEELRAMTGGDRKEAGIVTLSPPQDTATFHAIRAELDQVRELLSQNKNVDERQKELMRSIEDAGRQQREMLPDLPKIAGYEFEVLFKPMATVSGDFYDFLKVSPEETGLVLGDVSGHGVEAGIVMSMVKKCLKIHGRGQSSPAENLRVTNADVFEDLAQSTFASVSYGVLNTASRTLRFSRAGHTPLFLFNPTRQPDLTVIEPKGIVLGVDKGPVFNRTLEEMEIKLVAGDMLVQVTDGVLEATDKKKEEFGAERLTAAIRKYGTHEAKYLVHMLELAVNEFRGTCPAEDDVTILGVKVL